MNETTPNPLTDTIYFDASCGMCSTSAKRLEKLVCRRGFVLMPLQAPGVSTLLDFPADQIPDEMKLRTRTGQILSGADALVYICGQIWWAFPIWLISFIPGAMPILRFAYRRIARNRHRISQACRI